HLALAGQRHRLGAPAGDLPVVRAAAGDQLPEAVATDGVGNQVDAGAVGVVDHPVPGPGVEDPAFAGGHVDLGAAGLETHVGRGGDRHVHAHALAPVVVGVDVLGDFGLAGQAHQPRAAPGATDRRQHLAQARHLRQHGRRTHVAGEVVVVGITVGGNQG